MKNWRVKIWSWWQVGIPFFKIYFRKAVMTQAFNSSRMERGPGWVCEVRYQRGRSIPTRLSGPPRMDSIHPKSCRLPSLGWTSWASSPTCWPGLGVLCYVVISICNVLSLSFLSFFFLLLLFITIIIIIIIILSHFVTLAGLKLPMQTRLAS